jgi:soluble lytic murein transglycosylase-like protein
MAAFLEVRHIVRAATTLLIVLAAGCPMPRPEPKAEFLHGWLEQHAVRLPASQRTPVVDALLQSEEAYAVDALFLLAVMEEESRYDPRARSRKGARGLMQLRPTTAREVAREHGLEASIDDPAINVVLGAAYLAELKTRFGTWETALAAYNYGPRRIRQLQSRGSRIPTAYASRVRERHRRVREAYRRASP